MKKVRIETILSMLLVLRISKGGELGRGWPGKRSGLYGHFGSYSQNLTGYPKEVSPADLVATLMGALFGENSINSHQDVWKFLAGDYRPNVFVVRKGPGTEFQIWGPLYSLQMEAVDRHNQTTDGVGIEDENSYYTFFRDQPDFMMSPLIPQVRY